MGVGEGLGDIEGLDEGEGSEGAGVLELVGLGSAEEIVNELVAQSLQFSAVSLAFTRQYQVLSVKLGE